MEYEQIQNLYSDLHEYIFGHFELFWTVIIGVFAIIGIALFFLAKSIIAQGIEKESEKQSKKYSDLEARIDQIRSTSLRYHPTEYDLALEKDIKKVGICSFSKNSDDLVVVSISVRACEGELKPRIHKIATLPVGFRPSGVISQTVDQSTTLRVYKNGSIVYDTTTSLKELSFSSIIFYASEN